MTTKVTTIITTKGQKEMQALYEAAKKTFTLPPWGAVQNAIAGDTDDLKKFLIQEKESLAGTPFSGPTAWMPVLGGAVKVFTEGGRQVWVTPGQVGIDFVRDGDSGSTLAAGEIVGRLWADDPEDRLDGIIVTLADGSEVEHKEYSGLVHPQLGRYAWDSAFRQKVDAGETKWFAEA